MALERGRTQECVACSRRMIAAQHARTGNLAPIVLDPNADGNVLLWRDPDGGVSYTVIGKPDIRSYLVELGVPLRLNHFADCPNSSQFR